MKSRARTTAASSSAGRAVVADAGERLVPIGTVQLCFHVRERRPDDVVVVDVGADHLRGFPPHAVDEVEIAGRERRQVRAEVVGVGAAAAVMDDEPDVQRLRFRDAFPGLAEQPRLVGRRERRRFADVDRGRAQADDRRRQAVGHGGCGNDQQANRPAIALDERDHPREQVALRRQRRGIVGAGAVGVDAVEAHRHHHDLAVGAALQGGRHVLEGMRVPHRDEDVARLRVRVLDGNRGGGEEVEPFRLAQAFLLRALRCRESRRASPSTSAAAASQPPSPRASMNADTVAMATATIVVPIAPRRARRRDRRPRRRQAVDARSPQPCHRQGAQGDGRGDGHRVGASQPRDAAGAGQHQQHAGGGHDVEALGQRAQPRMRHRQRLRQHAGRREPAEQLAGVHHAGLDRRHEEERRGDAETGLQHAADPPGRREMTDEAGERDLGPRRRGCRRGRGRGRRW